MKYRRSLAVSAGLHLLVLLMLLLVSLTGREDEFVTETLRIRIRMQSTGGGPGTTVAGDPSVMKRTLRLVSELTRGDSGRRSSVVPESVRRVLPVPPVTGRTPDSGIPAAEEAVLEGLLEPDPLAGIEVADSPERAAPAGRNGPWSVSWSNGRERAILVFPPLDEEALPEYTERLSGLQIAISVSPAGDVVSAAILPPGSGDIRIDRYFNSLALELVLEPGFPEDGDQDGILRLVLSEGGE